MRVDAYTLNPLVPKSFGRRALGKGQDRARNSNDSGERNGDDPEKESMPSQLRHLDDAEQESRDGDLARSDADDAERLAEPVEQQHRGHVIRPRLHDVFDVLEAPALRIQGQGDAPAKEAELCSPS